METQKLKTEDGSQFGFEIDHVYISTSKISKILSVVDGISNIKKRKLFHKYENDEYRLEFDFNDETFLILEPFGDSSRYWVVPKDSDHISSDVSFIEEIFKQYQPHILIRIFGDIISLRPLFYFVNRFRCNVKPKKS